VQALNWRRWPVNLRHQTLLHGEECTFGSRYLLVLGRGAIISYWYHYQSRDPAGVPDDDDSQL
jgi:hypothetical protein